MRTHSGIRLKECWTGAGLATAEQKLWMPCDTLAHHKFQINQWAYVCLSFEGGGRREEAYDEN